MRARLSAAASGNGWHDGDGPGLLQDDDHLGYHWSGMTWALVHVLGLACLSAATLCRQVGRDMQKRLCLSSRKESVDAAMQQTCCMLQLEARNGLATEPPVSMFERGFMVYSSSCAMTRHAGQLRATFSPEA